MLRLSVALVGLAVSIAACGASSTTDTFLSVADGGSNDSNDAATSGSATAALDASASPAPRVADAAVGAGRCDRLLADVERLRAEAMTCSLTALDTQCDQLVEDVCCKLVVSGTSMNVAKFELAVRAFKDAKCSIDCKAITCPDAPTKICQPMSGGKGSCSQ